MKNEKKTERLAIRITPSQLRALRLAAANRNVTVGHYVLETLARRIVNEHSLDGGFDFE